MRDLLATMPVGYRSNIIYIPNAKETFSNRNHLKDSSFTVAPVNRNGALQSSVSSNQHPATQFYDRITLEPQEVIPLDHYAQCTLRDSGPYWAAFLKPGNDATRNDNSLQDVEGLTGKKLINNTVEEVPTKLTRVNYLKATLRVPRIDVATVRVDGGSGCDDSRTDFLGEVPNWYMGFFLPNYANFNNLPFEGVIQYNCPKVSNGAPAGWALAMHGLKDANGQLIRSREFPKGAMLINQEQDVEMEMIIEEGYKQIPVLNPDGTPATREVVNPDNTKIQVPITTYEKDANGNYVRTTGPGNNRVVVALTGNFRFYDDAPCKNDMARGCEDLGGGKQRVLIAFDNLPNIDPSSGVSTENVAYAQIGIAQGDASNNPTYKPKSGAWFYGMTLLGLEVAECSDFTKCARVGWNPGNIGPGNMNYKNYSTCYTQPETIPSNPGGINSTFLFNLEPDDTCNDLLSPQGSTGGGGGGGCGGGSGLRE
jgi:hypothetical protein